MNDTTTSISLLDRARSGENQAWTDLQRLYSPLVYYWLRRRGIGGQDLETIHNGLFSRAFLHLEGFRHNGRRGAFRGWLRRLTISEIGDRFGNERVGLPDDAIAPAVEIDPHDSDEDELVILSHQAWDLVRGEFTDRDQVVFRRVRINSESAGDVAADIGIKTNNLHQILFRITKRLRERFAGEFD